MGITKNARFCNCGYATTNSGNFNSHVRNCNAGEQININADLDRERQENKRLRKQVESLQKQLANKPTTVVNINVFGNEDLSHITVEKLREICTQPNNAIRNYFKVKHFDNANNKNIHIPNKSQKEVEIHAQDINGNPQKELRDFDSTMVDIVKDSADALQQFIDNTDDVNDDEIVDTQDHLATVEHEISDFHKSKKLKGLLKDEVISVKGVILSNQ